MVLVLLNWSEIGNYEIQFKYSSLESLMKTQQVVQTTSILHEPEGLCQPQHFNGFFKNTTLASLLHIHKGSGITYVPNKFWLTGVTMSNTLQRKQLASWLSYLKNSITSEFSGIKVYKWKDLYLVSLASDIYEVAQSNNKL